ncbi:hypothetical protein [Phenylobacterium sp.]|uniref:hypothetical protein n=1 Tax=Phenylobacterium sp. TaxID=1871053 RepID=UPI002F95AF96
MIVRAFTAVAAASILLAACTTTPETVSGASWMGPATTPAGQELMPDAAIRQRVSGWVLLACRAGQGATAEACMVLGEAPQGWGFGAGALRARTGVVAREFIYRPPWASDRPVEAGDHFLVPMIFCPPDEAGCADRVRVQWRAFHDEFRRIEALVRAGRCEAARPAVRATGQPGAIALVEGWCKA